MFANLMQVLFKSAPRPVKATDLGDFKRKHPNLILMDIRGENEAREEGFIPGSMRAEWNTPAFTEALRRMAPSRTVLIYCQRGKRSPAACQFLLEQGYSKVFYLDGGFATWQITRKRVALALSELQ